MTQSICAHLPAKTEGARERERERNNFSCFYILHLLLLIILPSCIYCVRNVFFSYSIEKLKTTYFITSLYYILSICKPKQYKKKQNNISLGMRINNIETFQKWNFTTNLDFKRIQYFCKC